MRITARASLVAAFLLATGVTAGMGADPGPWSHEISLEAGAAFPTDVNRFSDTAKMGPVAGARYLYRTSVNFAFGLQGEYYSFGAQERTFATANEGRINARSNDQAALLELIGRYAFLPAARVVPYFYAGAGAAHFQQVTKGEPAAGSGWADTGGTTETRQLQDANSTGLCASAGFGMETNLTQSLVLGLESAWHVLGVNRTSFGTSSLNVPSLSLRLGWRFGPEPFHPGF